MMPSTLDKATKVLAYQWTPETVEYQRIPQVSETHFPQEALEDESVAPPDASMDREARESMELHEAMKP